VAAASNIAASLAVAGGLTSPFRDDSHVGLSAADIKLMNGAIVFALEQRKTGAVSNWSDETTGRGGQVTILRTYQRRMAPCGEVQHVFTKGGGHTYKLPYCLQSDGSWKIQF
jgi:surface antigen